MGGFYRVHEKGLDVYVRLTPRSSKDAVEDVETMADGRSHLAARVRAVPEKGAANIALERLLASWLELARSDVCVIAGSTARLKTVRLTGNAADLARTLSKRWGVRSAPGLMKKAASGRSGL